jgi:hypothetical protein
MDFDELVDLLRERLELADERPRADVAEAVIAP